MKKTLLAGRAATRSAATEGGQEAVEREDPTSRDDRRFAALVCVCFAAAVAIMMVNHEMWRDELQAWLLTADSDSIADLIHKRRAEGHPALWYLLLYPLTRWTTDPAAMQALHLCFATGVVYVLARFAPFPRWQRVSIAAGYFLVFEYAVISRSYVVGVLALFGACALLPNRVRSYLGIAFLLGILANTSAYGVLLATAMAVALLVDGGLDARSGVALRHRKVANSIFLLAAAMGLAVLQMIRIDHVPPPPDASGEAVAPSLTWKSAKALASVYRAYMPLPDFAVSGWWNTSFLMNGQTLPLALAALVSIALLAVFTLRLLSRPAACLMYLFGSALMFVVSYRFIGGARHFGHHFLLLVATLWMARYVRPVQLIAPLAALNRRARGPARVAFVMVLVVQVAAGALYFAADLSKPFSTAKAAAEIIDSLPPDAALIAAPFSTTGSAVAGYLRRPVYYMHLGDFGTYSDWTLSGHGSVEGLERMEAMVRSGEYSHAVIASGRPVPDYLLAGAEGDWRFVEIARFEDGMIPSERYVLFRGTLEPSVSPADVR